MSKVGLVYLAVAILTPGAAQAAADFLLSPTRVLMQSGEVESAVTLANTGSERLTFEAVMVERRMDPEGYLQPAAFTTATWAASPYLIYAPRKFALEPGQAQVVRILAQRAPAMGELRSHLEVTAVGISRTYRVTLPIILRRGRLGARGELAIEHPRPLPDGRWQLNLHLRRTGTASLYGDMEYWLRCSNKRVVRLAARPGVAVYAESATRMFSFVFALPTAPAGACRMEATFRDHEFASATSSTTL